MPADVPEATPGQAPRATESPNKPRPDDELTRSVADTLRRIEANYDREGSGPGSRFEGRLLEDVQALAAVKAVTEAAELTWDEDLRRERDEAREQLRRMEDQRDELAGLVAGILQSLPDTADEQEWRDRAGSLGVTDPDGQPYRARTEDYL